MLSKKEPRSRYEHYGRCANENTAELNTFADYELYSR